MRRCRGIVFLIPVSTALAAACAALVAASPASATSRLGSRTLHTQLVSHVSASNGLVLGAADVMSALVAVLATLAFAFLVVTFIRRRVTTN
jgi:hypothetical protein